MAASTSIRIPGSVSPSNSGKHLLEVVVGRGAAARPVEQRRGDGVVAGVGEPAGDVLDVVVHPERLLDDDDRPGRPAFGDAGVEPHRTVGGGEGDVVDLHVHRASTCAMAGSADGRRLRCAPRGGDGRPRLRGLGRRATRRSGPGRAGGLGCVRRAVARGRRIRAETLERLDAIGSPATVATTGRRYFGFVIGATYPVALGSSWLASAWDQNAALPVMSPVAAKLHDVVRGWLVEAPAPSGGHGRGVRQRRDGGQRSLPRRGPGRAAGRSRLGRPGRRPVRCPAPSTSSSASGPTPRCRSRSGSSGSAATGSPSCRPTTRVACGPTRLPDLDGPVLVCAQAGEVNTGAFDPFDEIADWLAGAPVGCTSTAPSGCGRSPTRPGRPRARARPRRLVGDRRAQVAQRHLRLRHRLRPPARRPAPHVRATAGYLPPDIGFERHAPHTAVLATGRARSRCGRCCARSAGRASATWSPVLRRGDAIAERLQAGGLTILNDVVLNQVLVRLVDGPTTDALIAEVCSPTAACGAVRPSGTAPRRCASACRRGRPTSTTPPTRRSAWQRQDHLRSHARTQRSDEGLGRRADARAARSDRHRLSRRRPRRPPRSGTGLGS